MKRKLYLLVIMGTASLLTLCLYVYYFSATIPHHGQTWELSNRDVRMITAIVGKQTTEPVVAMNRKSFWQVEVMTGRDGPPNMANQGHTFFLHWTVFGWRIYKKGYWVS
jgi:hypothetical protein